MPAEFVSQLRHDVEPPPQYEQRLKGARHQPDGRPTAPNRDTAIACNVAGLRGGAAF